MIRLAITNIDIGLFQLLLFLLELKALYSQNRQNKMAILSFIEGQFYWRSALSVVSFIGIPIKSIDFIEHIVVLSRKIKEQN